MTVVSAKTNPYGPCTVNIQIEQGADFVLPMTVSVGGDLIDLLDPDVTVDAHCSPTWSPGQRQIDFTVTPDPDQTVNKGKCVVSFPAASSAPGSDVLGMLPAPAPKDRVFMLGNWIFNLTQDGVISRIIDGTVQLDRDPISA